MYQRLIDVCSKGKWSSWGPKLCYIVALVMVRLFGQVFRRTAHDKYGHMFR